MSDHESILDRVLETQVKEDQAQFDPENIVFRALKGLPERDRNIVIMRHGLNKDNIKQTLEEIGKNHSITRERVRQIESASVKQVRNKMKDMNDYNQTIGVVEQILRKQGGVSEEMELVERIRDLVSDKPGTNIVVFFLNLVKDNFLMIKESAEVRAGWQVVDFNNQILSDVLSVVKNLLEKQDQILPFDNLWNKFKYTEIYQKYDTQINQDGFLSFISLSKKIESNPFDDWGLSSWNLIIPRRMNDKIYLVLKHHGKPLHFRDITDNINKVKFDKKRAHSTTVHNELIMDSKRYVLIGRGIYALKEWGYKPGVVADVIKEILAASDRPMKKKEIIAEVLNKRMVKETTVILALTNRKKFKKLTNGSYELADN